MHFPRNTSCKIHNCILAVTHGISSSHLNLSKKFKLEKEEAHIQIPDTKSYVPPQCQCNHDCCANSSTEEKETL